MRRITYCRLILENWIEDVDDKSFERFRILDHSETGEPLTPADKMNAKILITDAHLKGWGHAPEDRVAVIRDNDDDPPQGWWLDELLASRPPLPF